MKILAIIAAAVVSAGTLFGTVFSPDGEKYKIEYDSKGLYNGAKDSYKAGQNVTLYFSAIATNACMPENGREGMGKIREILESYIEE